MNRKYQSIYKSGSVVETLKPRSTVVIRHPFNIVPVRRQKKYVFPRFDEAGTEFRIKSHFMQEKKYATQLKQCYCTCG